MNYIVNEKLKTKINKEILDKRKPEFRIRYYIFKVLFVVPWLIFFIPFIMTLPLIVFNVRNGYLADAFGFMVIWLLAFIGAMVFVIIPAAIRSKIHEKYLMPWVAKKEECVEITDKYIEQGFYNPWYGEHYWTNTIRFAQLVQIEYDDYQKLLRVYGPIEIKEWIRSDKTQCWDKTAADPNAGMSQWIEIPAFYENFEELMKELEEMSGKEIINREREFMYYK